MGDGRQCLDRKWWKRRRKLGGSLLFPLLKLVIPNGVEKYIKSTRLRKRKVGVVLRMARMRNGFDRAGSTHKTRRGFSGLWQVTTCNNTNRHNSSVCVRARPVARAFLVVVVLPITCAIQCIKGTRYVCMKCISIGHRTVFVSLLIRDPCRDAVRLFTNSFESSSACVYIYLFVVALHRNSRRTSDFLHRESRPKNSRMNCCIFF